MHEEISNELMQKNSQWRKSILNEFIHTSKTDLESCVILYDKQLYQQAIFSFQQSIEKAIKVYWLLLNPMTTEKELKQQIGHDSITVYENLAKLQVDFYKNSAKT